MKRLKFAIDGTETAGTAALAGGTMWVHIDGETIAVETAKATRRGASAKSGTLNPGQIAAPMPGKIIKVMAAKDASVAAGQVLLVMEAMKMEYTLKASAAGTVASVDCVAGDQVALGQILMKLETKESSK